MGIAVANLFADLVVPGTGEVVDELVRTGSVRIERISSSAHPEPVLYDQSQDEWVLLLQGEARLDVGGEEIVLGPGDHLLIAAHTQHRVLWTSAEPPCLWLAVHIDRTEVAPDPLAGSAPDTASG